MKTIIAKLAAGFLFLAGVTFYCSEPEPIEAEIADYTEVPVRTQTSRALTGSDLVEATVTISPNGVVVTKLKFIERNDHLITFELGPKYRQGEITTLW